MSPTVFFREVQNEVVSDFTRRLWIDFIKGRPRHPQILATGTDAAGGDGQVRVNACYCQAPCGAVECKPGMVYAIPDKWPKLPE